MAKFNYSITERSMIYELALSAPTNDFESLINYMEQLIEMKQYEKYKVDLSSTDKPVVFGQSLYNAGYLEASQEYMSGVIPPLKLKLSQQVTKDEARMMGYIHTLLFTEDFIYGSLSKITSLLSDIGLAFVQSDKAKLDWNSNSFHETVIEFAKDYIKNDKRR